MVKDCFTLRGAKHICPFKVRVLAPLQKFFIMESLYRLQKMLEKSIEKQGNIPLTTSHLFNMISLIIKQYEKEEEDFQQNLYEALEPNDIGDK